MKPSSFASPLIPNSATLRSPRSAKLSPTSEAREIPSPTIAESKNNPGDLVQTNHFNPLRLAQVPPPLSRLIKIADASPDREYIHPPENANAIITPSRTGLLGARLGRGVDTVLPLARGSGDHSKRGQMG